jgi:esterase/lipase superfamily enzyme
MGSVNSYSVSSAMSICRSSPVACIRLLGALGLAVTVLAGCASAPKAGSAAEAAEPKAHTVDLFYVTDRAARPTGEEDFGGERGTLSYGIASVGIPASHEIGHREAPSVFRFEWSADERKHIAVKGLLPLDQAEFLQQLGWAIEKSRDRRLMVFVHGYNTPFAEAARLVAQFATDLKFGGPVLLFSWPSEGSLTGYAVDETNAEWAQPHLVQTLKDLLDRTPAKRIYLVAHSMGARVLTRSYLTLAGDRWVDGPNALREMILVAPDIDSDLFRQDIADRVAKTGIHVTLYASSGDRALMASHAFHGYARAGDSGEGLIIVPGVETVDASQTSTGFIGHSYFSEDRRIMEDIYAILQTGERADNRFGLTPVDTDKGRYWTFRK